MTPELETRWREVLRIVCDQLEMPWGAARIETMTPPGVKISRGGMEIVGFGQHIQCTKSPEGFLRHWSEEIIFGARGAVRPLISGGRWVLFFESPI